MPACLHMLMATIFIHWVLVSTISLDLVVV